MNIEQEINRLTIAVLKANLRKVEHEEAKAAAERRVAEMCEVHAIERLAKLAKKGRP